MNHGVAITKTQKLFHEIISSSEFHSVLHTFSRIRLKGIIEKAVQYHSGAWQKIVFVVLADKTLRVENVFECVVRLPQTPYVTRRTMLYTPSKLFLWHIIDSFIVRGCTVGWPTQKIFGVFLLFFGHLVLHMFSKKIFKPVSEQKIVSIIAITNICTNFPTTFANKSTHCGWDATTIYYIGNL